MFVIENHFLSLKEDHQIRQWSTDPQRSTFKPIWKVETPHSENHMPSKPWASARGFDDFASHTKGLRQSFFTQHRKRVWKRAWNKSKGPKVQSQGQRIPDLSIRLNMFEDPVGPFVRIVGIVGRSWKRSWAKWTSRSELSLPLRASQGRPTKRGKVAERNKSTAKWRELVV